MPHIAPGGRLDKRAVNAVVDYARYCERTDNDLTPGYLRAAVALWHNLMEDPDSPVGSAVETFYDTGAITNADDVYQGVFGWCEDLSPAAEIVAPAFRRYLDKWSGRMANAQPLWNTYWLDLSC